MAADDGLTPFSDEEVTNLLISIRKQSLATDQRNLVTEKLDGRSLTCQQAGALLEAVKLGFIQRKIASEVISGRLSDLPDGLPDVLAPLTGEIRREMEARCLSPRSLAARREAEKVARESSSTPVEPFDRSAPQTLSNSLFTMSSPKRAPANGRKENWHNCVDRVREHVANGNVTGELYQDLAAAFDALGLGPLPAPVAGALILEEEDC